MGVLTMKFIETTFTSVEAEMITGITKIRQRDWRRHGYLSGGLGRKWKRYSLTELAQLAITGHLQQLGVRPAISTSMSGADKNKNKSAAGIVTILVKNDPASMADAARLNGKLPVKLPQNWRPPKFLVVTSQTSSKESSSIHLADDVQNIFDGSTVCGIVIDLRAIARQLIDRSRKPLVRLLDDRAKIHHPRVTDR
jgi:hypothetical protein